MISREELKRLVEVWAKRQEEWCCEDSEIENHKKEVKGVFEWLDIAIIPGTE